MSPWVVSAQTDLQARLSVVEEIGPGLVRDAQDCAWRTVVGDYGELWAVSRHWDWESCAAYLAGGL